MPRPGRGGRAAVVLALSGVCLATVSGCGKQAEPVDRFAGRTPNEIYTIRGVVPETWAPGVTLRISHEPVHHLVDESGMVVGMNSMVMEFPDIGAGVDVDAITPGMAVEFDLEVFWTPRGYRVSRLERIEASDLDLVGSADPARAMETDRHPAEPHVYAVRGRIEQLPDPDRPASDLVIRHERIEGFKNHAGEAVGMDAMAMPFPTLNDEALFDGYAVGDLIEVVFVVTYEGTTPRYPIVKVTRLPAGTELELGG